MATLEWTGKELLADKILTMYGKGKDEPMKMQLWTVVVLRHRVTDEKHGIINTEVLLGPKNVLAANQEAARVVAIAGLGEKAVPKPEELEVFTRPF